MRAPGTTFTIKTKGCLSRTTALTMVFKLCQSAVKKWRGLDGSHRLAEIVEGVKFKVWTLLTKVETSCDRILIAGGANVEAEWEQGPAV